MKKRSICLGCKAILALVIIAVFLTPTVLGQQLICTVSGSNFQLYGSWSVTRIEVSHYYSSNGGWVKLIDANGNEYGPWSADTSSNIWKVYFNSGYYLMPGTYRMVDSEPGTYQGQAWIYGNS